VRKADLRKNHQALDDALSRYRDFLAKIIGAQRVVNTAQEKRDIAESVILRICAHWERFVDGHLVDCINRDHSKLSEYFELGIPANPSRDLCEALIIGDRYTDFRSVGEIKHEAKCLLPDGSNPFLAITKAHAGRIDEAYKIRNYLSHYSTKAYKALRRVYEQQYGMQNFLEPGYFLLGYNAKRLWTYIDAFQGASNDMKATYP
jgi:hypothetical protein